MSTYYWLKRSIKYEEYDFRMIPILIKLQVNENGKQITDIVILFFNSFNLVI